VDSSQHAALLTGWRVTAATPNGSTIKVTVQDKSGRENTVEADYVLGCDGARSVIRDTIGARFDGRDDGRRNVNVTFRAPGLATEVPHGNAVQYWVLNPQQPGLMGRLDLDGSWWCIANVTPETAETHAASIVRATTGSGTPVEVLATDAWTARMQLADRYARGRMFIAGDAAHQNPPYGGHGFYTGIGDAVNIAWKLAAVLNGWAPPALLETYESERKPVALDTIAEAARNMATLATELADPKLVGTSEAPASWPERPCASRNARERS
jgi:2-polyprenyl-6-methoxyphenol hydroxylase-like FAD-dependent oxidoreductase